MPNSKNIFPFFKLPRELRDSIYELATTDRLRIETEAEKFRLFVLNSLIKNMLLVNRQFMIEYLERTSKLSSLVFDDYYGCELGCQLYRPCSAAIL